MELARAQWSLARQGAAQEKALSMIAVLSGLSYVLWLIYSSSEVGIPRDESVYLYAADRISAWIPWATQRGQSPLSREAIDHAFGFNHEHPALMKELFALSHSYLHQRWGLISDPTLAYRLPTILLSALTVSVTSLFAGRLAGAWAALGAGLSLIAMPRLFFHAHLACFDAPVMCLWLLIVWAYLKARDSGGAWVALSGVTLGLGLGTKLNATFAPFLLLSVSLFHLLCLRRAEQRAALKQAGLRYLWIGLSMLTIGLGVFWAHWPWLYHDAWPRLLEYIQFHARHEHYPVDYFGTLYYRPPFPLSFPFVMLGLTVPLVTLILGAWGFFESCQRAIERWRSGAIAYPIEALLLINFLFALSLIALPNTPIFGGTKHWITSMPFLAIFAGIALERARSSLLRLCPDTLLNSPRQSLLVGLCFTALCFSSPLIATARYGAHGPAYYNHVIGGPSGAAARRLPRDFWGYSSVAILPTLNERAARGAGVFWHNATGAAVWRYHRDGRLRTDIKSTGDWTSPYADWGVYHSQREKRSEELDLWWAYGTTLPSGGYFVDGVQLIGLYQSPKSGAQSPELSPELSPIHKAIRS